MKKRVVLFLLLALFLFPTILAGSPDAEIQKLTHYAEEYEIGNIDYVKLLVYISSVRESLNEELGATHKYMGGVVRQEQIRKILGEPTDETKWVWVEGEERDVKLDYYVPVWRKIIFDGKKIQISLEAFPSIFRKKHFEDEFEEKSEAIEEGSLIYRLHFNIEFKKPQEHLDILGKINEIKSLAEIFNANPSSSNAETLAKESVNAERMFENYFRQNQGKCEDLMMSIFGSENQREIQKILLNEINFYDGDNFEAIIRLEMCDDCEWNWINLDMWLEGRGPGFRPPEKVGDPDARESRERFEGMNSENFKAEVRELIGEIRRFLEEGDYGPALNYAHRLRMLNDAWNEKANNVWEQIEKPIEQPEGSDDPYYWIKQDQTQRQRANELRQRNYEDRKAFYLDLFSEYYKREYYFEQKEWEKRLIQEFKEKGEEICNNNQDDNENEQIDCADAQCGGQICGRGTTTITEGNQTNQTIEIEVDFYCISGTCQAKPQEIEEEEVVCGNHICEGNETITSCSEDCATCPEHPPINCSGKVIFKGKDENGCPLPPTCIEETEFCQTNEDCLQPLCGIAECIIEPEDEVGKCQIVELTECNQTQCTDGQEKVKNCESGEQIITSICMNGLWMDIDNAVCPNEQEEFCGDGICQEGEMCDTDCCEAFCTLYCPHGSIEGSCGCECIFEEEPIAGNECEVKEDCGGENDVCSNGHCETLPEVIEPEEEEIEISEPEEPEEEQPEEQPEPEVEEQEPEEEESEPEEEEAPEETPATGEIIFSFFRTLIGRITGRATEDGEGGDSTEEKPAEEPEPEPEEPTPEPEETPQETEEPEEDFEEEKPEDDREERDRGERQRREEEQKQRCNQECKRPCVEKCIREACGETMECDIDEESRECEGQCKASQDCVEKCMSGDEDWWKEFEEEHKEEKGVFAAGGSCRKQQGKTEGFIWLGGWGEPFGDIQYLKNKYYSGGHAEWCKYDLESFIRQRQEFEKGFNQEFAVWFFEKYLPNSAENWEQSVSGIFEIYWNNVDNQMEIAHRMQCLEINDIGELMDYNLIEFNYDTEYGSIEYWEEAKEVRVPGLEEKVIIISPYMKVWIFPPEAFIRYEMKEAMKNHEFPGPPEEKMKRGNEEGLTAEEKEMIKRDRGFMNKIKEVADKYGGNVNAVVQFKDYETNEVIFNLYVQVNEEDIMKMEPMLPEEVPAEDVRIEIDFEKIYDMIYFMEKEMNGAMIETPPWDRKPFGGQGIKGIIDGVRMWFMMQDIINSAKVYPESAAGDVKDLFKKFFNIMSKEKKGREMEEEEKFEDKGILESKEKITGEVIGKI